jgi:hypothetical protein
MYKGFEREGGSALAIPALIAAFFGKIFSREESL